MTCPKHQTSTQLGTAAHIFALFAALVSVGLALSAIETWHGLTAAGTTGQWTESARIVAPLITASAAGLLALTGWTVSAVKAVTTHKCGHTNPMTTELPEKFEATTTKGTEGKRGIQ